MDWLSRELISQQMDLKKERQLLEKLLRNLDAGVAYIDSGHVYRMVNPQFARYFGHKPEDFLGKRQFTLIPELSEFFQRVLDEVARDLKPVHVRRLPLSYPDGEGQKAAFIDGTATPLISEAGRLEGILILCFDVTDTVLLEEQRLRQAAIVEGSFDAIIAGDLDGKIISWNKSATRIYGYTAQEAIGQSVSITIPKEKRDELPRAIQKMLEGEKPHFFLTERMRKSGERFPAGLSIAPVYDSRNQIVAASAIVRDLSETVKDLERVV